MALGADSVTNGMEYKKYFLGAKGSQCIGLTTLPTFADCLKIWKPQPTGNFIAHPGL
jgi:hypothetical protein